MCPKKQACKPCDQPHFFLIDQAYQAKPEKGILVADYKAAVAEQIKIEEELLGRLNLLKKP